MENDKIIEELTRLRRLGIKNKDLARDLGCSPGYLSEVISRKKQAGKDLSDSLEKMIVTEQPTRYAVASVVEGLSPAEYEMIKIARECPEAVAVVRMMGAVDSDTQKDIQRVAEKEKLMYDLMKERRDKGAA